MPDRSTPRPPALPDPATAPLTPEVRDRVADFLAARFAEDALSLEEFERRVALVWTASTPHELIALAEDLRAAPQPSPPAIVSSVPPRKKLKVVLGNLERAGAIELPRRLDIRVVLGNAELDLRDASFAPGASEIAIEAVAGNVEITLPSGVHVESHGIGILGSFECRTPVGRARAVGPSVRITGRAVLSAVTIRTV